MKDIKLQDTDYRDSAGVYLGRTNDINYVKPYALSTHYDIVMVEGKDRTEQGIVKILLTELNPNNFLANYGSKLQSLVGTNILDPALETTVRDTITQAIQYLALAEESTVKSEQIKEITAIDVITDINAHTVSIKLSVVLQSNETVTKTFGGF
jgi:phage baseplate assembly protein W